MSNNMSEHILIGSGGFGLGFIGELFIKAANLKTSIIIANRESDIRNVDNKNWILERDKSYEIVYPDGTERTIDGFNFISCDFVDPQNALDLLCSKNLKLITIALPMSVLREVSTLLAIGFKARIESGLKIPLVVTCVNEMNNGIRLHSYVQEKLPEVEVDSGYFPVCIVDRVCLKPKVINQRVKVQVENHASLIVERTDFTNILEGYNTIWFDRFSRNILEQVDDIGLPQSIKYIGVNGLHLFIAAIARSPIYSRHESEEDEDRYIKNIIKDPKVKSYIDGFIDEVCKMIYRKFPSQTTVEILNLYLSENLRRFETTEDNDIRLLKDLRLDKSIESVGMIEALLSQNRRELDFNITIDKIIDNVIGNFLRKVDLRLIRPIFEIYTHEQNMSVNLTTGASCILYAMAKQTDKE